MATGPSSRPTKSASVIAASGGTGALGLAQLLPLSWGHVREIAVLAAPTIGVLLGGVWSLVQYRVYALGRLLMIRMTLGDARKQEARIEADPKSTPALKRKARGNVEGIETLLMELATEDTKAIRARLKGEA